jgi:hypothetical protein
MGNTTAKMMKSVLARDAPVRIQKSGEVRKSIGQKGGV